MFRYRLEAEGQDGTPVSGVLTAPDLTAAREGVEARRLLPVRVLEIARIDVSAPGPQTDREGSPMHQSAWADVK